MDRTAVTVASFDATAQAYENRFMDCGLYEQSLHAFAAALPAHARVLDVGCGPGNTALFLSRLRSDLELTGVDLAPAMVELFRRNLPAAAAHVLDIRDLNRLSGRFDAALASFCLPFLSDEEAAALIGNLARLLTPGGLVYLATMRGSGEGFEKTSFGGDRQFFFRYYEREQLDAMLAAAGLATISYREQLFPQQNAPDLVDLIYIARLGDHTPEGTTR